MSGRLSGHSSAWAFRAVDDDFGFADADGAGRIVFLHRKRRLSDLEMPAEENRKAPLLDKE
jgi:hypothetical protein